MRQSTLSRWVVSFLCLVLLSQFLATVPVSAQDEFEPPPTRPIYWTGEYDFIPSSEPFQAEELLFPYNDESRTVYVFSKYNRDTGIIDICFMPPSRDLHCLTQDSAVDIHSRLTHDASKIVFSSNLGGRYDIYSILPSGQQRVRLTQGGIYDSVNPDWSPDGSKIVFESYPAGHGDIYVMNANGSGLKRLTSHTAYDGEPAWSPDGTKIAFISNRSGGYRIWTMNPDGTGLRQMNNQPYSTRPTWSPDGELISFSADANGDGWFDLWVMDVSGSNSRLLLPAYVHSMFVYEYMNNCWSPMMRYIGLTYYYWGLQQGEWILNHTDLSLFEWDVKSFNYLYSGDGMFLDWKSTDTTPPTSSVSPLPAYSTESFRIDWTGSDGNGLWVKSFDIQVRDGTTGAWTMLWEKNAGNLWGIFYGIKGHTYYFRSRARDAFFNLEAWPATPDTFTTIDNVAPVTYVKPLPPYTRGAPFTVYWTGEDQGAGIAGFDIQIKVGAGGWTDWIQNTLDTTAVYAGEVGVPVAFRSRAVDLMGNQEAYPSTPDSQTIFYGWQGSGSVLTNYGLPVDATLILDPPASVESHPEPGAYYALIGDVPGGLVTASWAKPGYGILPAQTIFSGQDMLDSLVVLPPPVNLVENWNFEAATLESWTTGGDNPPELTTIGAHNGSQGVLLGKAPLPTIQQAPGITPTFWHEMTVTLDGALHLAYFREVSPGLSALKYTRRSPEGTWSTVQTISGTMISSSAVNPIPGMCATADGGVHLFWVEITGLIDLHYSHRTPAGVWEADKDFGSNIKYRIRCTDDNSLYVLARPIDGLVFYIHHRDPAGVWTTESFGLPGPVSNLNSFDIINDENNQVILGYDYEDRLYLNKRTTTGWVSLLSQHPLNALGILYHNHGKYSTLSGYFQVEFAQLLSGERWTSPKIFSFSEYAKIDTAFDSEGDYYISYPGSPLGYQSDGIWQENPLLINPRMLLDADDRLHAVNFENSIINYYQVAHGFNSRTQFTSPTPPANLEEIWFDPAGLMQLAWVDTENHVYTAALSQPPAQDRISTLSQQLTIPADMPSPNLSFLYQLDHENSSDGSSLVVSVDNGTTTDDILTLTDNQLPWNQATADLSAYIGQTITLTFRLTQKTGEALTLSYLDEVSVGPAQPDLWVAGYGPAALRPAQQASIKIAYGNRGAQAGLIDINFTLPDGISLVSADPAPDEITNNVLVWHLPPLPARTSGIPIEVVLLVDNDETLLGSLLEGFIGISTTIEELELTNNITPFNVWIGDRVFLPLLKR